MRDGKGPSEKVMGRVSRVPLRVVIPIGVALLVVMMIVSVGTAGGRGDYAGHRP